MDSRDYVRGLIRGYYSKVRPGVDRVSEREFGVGGFDRKVEQRHMAFASNSELWGYLARNAPLYVSHSTAYYRYPDARPMEKKEWLGSELVFDLDATDMNLPCKTAHGSEWVCEECLEAVRAETVKLVEEFLVPDFGFSESVMSINFSGNRGYHVHVFDDEVQKLGPDARKEISDYISGNGIRFEEFFPTSGQRGVALYGPTLADHGWRGKLARSFVERLGKGAEALEELGIDRPTARRLYKSRVLVESGISKGNWDMIEIKRKAEFWNSIIARQTIAQSDRIDKNVTTDTSHLIRLADTIHGGTGLVSRRIPSLKMLATYEPMKECIAFAKGEVLVKADTRQRLVMNGMEFGPFRNVQVALPVYAGVYLYLKGFGKLAF